MAGVGAIHQQDTRVVPAGVMGYPVTLRRVRCTLTLASDRGHAVADCHATITRAELHCQRTITLLSHPSTPSTKTGRRGTTRRSTITQPSRDSQKPIGIPSHNRHMLPARRVTEN
jgi:hypothetical protein